MSIKPVVVRQYQKIADQAAGHFQGTGPVPPEGWIATIRKALGMSGAQLAKRMGLTRARIFQAERSETEGGITLKTMQAMAEAMGCRFVYAIVPEGRVEDVVAVRAREKARTLVGRAGGHMALEQQGLSDEQNAEEVERVAQELIRTLPSDLWADK